MEHFQLSASELLQITTNRVLHPSHCTLVVVNVAGGFTHALPHNMLLQSRRVYSLEFLPVAVLDVRSPSYQRQSHKFVRLGDITSPAAMIGYLKVNQLKGCHTQKRRIAPLAKVAVDNAETVCSR